MSPTLGIDPYECNGIAAELQAAGFTIDRAWPAAGFALLFAHTET